MEYSNQVFLLFCHQAADGRLQYLSGFGGKLRIWGVGPSMGY